MADDKVILRIELDDATRGVASPGSSSAQGSAGDRPPLAGSGPAGPSGRRPAGSPTPGAAAGIPPRPSGGGAGLPPRPPGVGGRPSLPPPGGGGVTPGVGAAVSGLAVAATAAAVAVGAMVVTAEALRRTFKLVNDEADRAARFNATVAAAASVGEARELAGNIRRADRIAPQLADFTLQRDATLEELRELRTTLAGTVAPTVADALVVANSVLRLLNDIAENPLFELVKDISWDVVLQGLGLNPAIYDLLMKALRKYTEPDEIGDLDLLEDINDLLDPHVVGR